MDRAFELDFAELMVHAAQHAWRSRWSAPATAAPGFDPRPLSQPWLYEAIGTAEWTGTSLWPLLERAGLRDDAVELVFTGADRGVQGEIEQDYQRSLTVDEVKRPEVMLAYEMNGRPLEPQHGYPGSPDRPRLVRHDEREVADVDRGRHGAVRGLPADAGLPLRDRRRRTWASR